MPTTIQYKTFALKAFLPLLALSIIFGIVVGSYAYAGTSSSFSFGAADFDVSIDRVKVNGAVLAESETNLIADADIFFVIVDFTAIETLEKGHIEAILRGRQTGDVISNSTGTFDLAKNQSSTAALALVLIGKLKSETEFDLTVKIVDVRDSSTQKTYGIKTRQVTSGRALDVSIDRVRINSRIVVPSRTNFIDESNDFDVLVEFTALEELRDAHVEAVLRDLKSGTVIADASPNFNLAEHSSSSKLLRLELLDKLKQSNSFELTVRVIDAEGSSIEQIYGIQMRNGGANGGSLDISIDSVEAESELIAEDENNFIVISEDEKNMDITIRLTSLEAIKDAHVDAVLTFENGDSVADSTAVFDLAKGEHSSKRLELPLIGKFAQANFGLKLRIENADGDLKEKFYSLKISHIRLPFVISRISLSPENNAEAGKTLIVVLSLRDIGVVPLESVSAKLSISELGISSTKSIPMKGGLPEITEEFILKIPSDAETGEYNVMSEVISEFPDFIDTKSAPVFILGKSDQVQMEAKKLLITIPVLSQDIGNDGSEVIYPITLRNDGTSSNTYILSLDGMGWAEIRLSDSNVFILKPKESKTLNIYSSTNTDKSDEQSFMVTIKDNERILKQITLTGNIVNVKEDIATFGDFLKALFIGLAIIAAAIAAVFGVRKLMKRGGSTSSDDEAEDDIPISEGSEGEYYPSSKEIGNEIPDSDKGEGYY